jgi:hypothetical protein
VPDREFVPIFHAWIRARALDLVLLDVADYTHVPHGPGVMLVAHEATFALDRADGRFGLRAQQRRPVEGSARDAVAVTLHQALTVADRLEADRRLRGRLSFDRSRFRVEANDRLRAPNNDASFDALAAAVRSAVADTYPDAPLRLARATSDARERLAVDVEVTPSG